MTKKSKENKKKETRQKKKQGNKVDRNRTF